jgi:tetratricopeptide (TPR) repeat protein
MINTSTISVFISYSRKDSVFVDRLEADLRARSFLTWVDRRKLEGGQNWLDMLERAIDLCNVLLVVLSPDAVMSDNVKMEYRYAKDQGRLIIPVELRTCPKVPIDLNSIQWVSFKNTYEQGLKDLLIALSPLEAVPNPPANQKTTPLTARFGQNIVEPPLVAPQPAPRIIDRNLNELYKAGITAKAEGNLERTAILWQQVLDRDPNFGNGILAQRMKQIAGELQLSRVQRLRKQAEEAHRAGMWRQAIGAWQALLGLEPQDAQAHDFLPIAEHNQKYELDYENATQFIKDDMLPSARAQLELLWHDAPYYGDPNRLARSVGLQVPKGYEQVWMSKQKSQATKVSQNNRSPSLQDAQRELGISTGAVNFWIFCLITGLGTTIGNATLYSLLYRFGIVLAAIGYILIITILAVLPYFALNYRKVMTPTSIISIAMLSGFVALILISFQPQENFFSDLAVFILGIVVSIAILIYQKLNLMIAIIMILILYFVLHPLSDFRITDSNPRDLRLVADAIVNLASGMGLGATLFIQRKEITKGFRFVLTKLGLL